GEPHHWRSMGGDAQKGDLSIMFDGKRVNATYDPMRKQGAILLGNGGDNSVGSQGTFYEAAMTAPNTFPTRETNQQVQANIVAAKYGLPRLSIAPASDAPLPPGLQTFSPASSQDTTVTFRNTTGAPVTGLQLSISGPAGWSAGASKSFAGPFAPGATLSATFKVTSGPAAFNGDLVGKASWTANGATQSAAAMEKVRSVSPVKINEFRISAGANPTDSFIELYNASSSTVDISNWTLTHHPTQLPAFSSVKIPSGTSLGAKRFYLLGLSTSGLAVAASAGDSTIYVRSTAGLNAGDTITLGAGAETRKIVSLGTAAGAPTVLWQPLPDGPVMTIPAGSTNVPFTAVGGGRGAIAPAGFEAGQKIALGHGATYPAVSRSVEKYEVVTVTAAGKPGTQAWLTAPAKAGDTNIKVSSLANITAGDQIRLDIDSIGHGIETVTVMRVGTQSTRNAFNGALRPDELGTGLELSGPLKFNHSSNIPFSARGTGITFTPKTAFAHSSNEPIMMLGTGIKLDQPLAMAHEIDSVVRNAADTSAGYQGTSKPSQWFGGPALGPAAGNMVLRDSAGLVVDSLNFGGLVDPWAAEGYQALSGAGANGCSVASPSAGGRAGPGGAQPTTSPNRSSGRFPDGADSDSNCNDFHLQTITTTAVATSVGANNIKAANTTDFGPGQTIIIDTGANQETAIVATVGTPGAATVGTGTPAGATVIPVASPAGFTPGQTITIDSGANLETAVVVSNTGGGAAGRGGPAPGASVTVAAPLTRAHAAGAQISGTGITIVGGLTKAHDSGAQVASGLPTPGAPNQFRRRN
ncbi:MAG: arabinofuranosidase catalytic domain-containing protein, partial [Acidobacteriota bacterium]